MASGLTGNEVPLDRGCGFDSRALRSCFKLITTKYMKAAKEKNTEYIFKQSFKGSHPRVSWQ